MGLIFGLAAANDFSEALSKRVKRTITLNLKKASEGKQVQLGGWIPRWVKWNEQNNAYEIYEPNAKTVRAIVQDYLSGKSMISICKWLNQNHIPKLKNGKVWKQGMVKSILETPALIGRIKINGVECEKYIPSVIDEPTFYQLQARLAENSNRKGGSRDNERIANLFRNRVFCVKCGGVINTHSAGGGQPYYKCKNARFGMDCTRKMVSVRQFENQFVALHFMSLDDLLPKENKSKQTEIETLKGKKILIEKKIQELIKLLGLNLPDLETEFAKCKTELEEIEKEMREKLCQDVRSTVDREKIKQFIHKIENLKEDLAKKRHSERVVEHTPFDYSEG